MSIQLPPKPWKDGDTFVNSQEGGTDVEYTYDGVKWFASGGEESDLSAFATKVSVDEVDRTAIMRDDALKKEHDEDSAKQSVINAGVVVSLDELFWRDVAIEQGAREDDEKLQAEIDELALALNTILVNHDSGQWKYKGPLSAGPPREPGELSILEDMSDTDNYITMHAEDLNGTTHTHTDLEVGDYMELVNVDNPQQYLLYVVTQTLLAAVNMLEVHVSLKRKSGDDFAIGAKLEVRYYAMSGQDIALEDLDERYVTISGDTMTGTLTVPRFDVKKTDDEAICLIEGKVDGTGSSARLTFSNKINPNAYGNLEWHGNNGNGWFQFNKDVDFSSKNLHSVNHLRLSGEQTIQEGQSNRIKLDGKVVILKSGDSNVDGFVIKGKTDEGNDSNLLSVYHNANGIDALNYKGKQESASNVATCGYVDNMIRNVGTPLPTYKLLEKEFKWFFLVEQ